MILPGLCLEYFARTFLLRTLCGGLGSGPEPLAGRSVSAAQGGRRRHLGRGGGPLAGLGPAPAMAGAAGGGSRRRTEGLGWATFADTSQEAYLAWRQSGYGQRRGWDLVRTIVAVASIAQRFKLFGAEREDRRQAALNKQAHERTKGDVELVEEMLVRSKYFEVRPCSAPLHPPHPFTLARPPGGPGHMLGGRGAREALTPAVAPARRT